MPIPMFNEENLEILRKHYECKEGETVNFELYRDGKKLEPCIKKSFWDTYKKEEIPKTVCWIDPEGNVVIPKDKTFSQISDTRERIFRDCIGLLSTKVKEYKNTDDRFENFTEGAKLNNNTREQTLWGYVTKQIVSVSSILRTKTNYSKIREKAMDIIIYMVILIDMINGSSDDQALK